MLLMVRMLMFLTLHMPTYADAIIKAYNHLRKQLDLSKRTHRRCVLLDHVQDTIKLKVIRDKVETSKKKASSISQPSQSGPFVVPMQASQCNSFSQHYSSDFDAEKNERCQSTLQFATNLLLQIHQLPGGQPEQGVEVIKEVLFFEGLQTCCFNIKLRFSQQRNAGIAAIIVLAR
ncbi:hypothetical protein Tco_1116428, partial [Tanacetum coccineum]